MPSVRPFVTAGVALVGASVIAVSPVTPPQSQIRTVGMDVNLVAATTSDFCEGPVVRLCDAAASGQQSTPFAAADIAAGSSIFNIPANLFIALANVPYNFFNALGQGDVNLGDLPDSGFSFVNSRAGIDLNQTEVVGLTADLEYGGSWWMYHPFNVLGTDSADIARYQSLVNVLLPFPALSVGLGNILTTVAASQLPMNVGCTGTNIGGCDHPEQILSKMFDLRHVIALFSPGGYTFPAVNNPITCGSEGLCDIKNPEGERELWSEQNYALNIFDPFANFYNSLTETPDFSQIKVPTLQMIVNTIVGLVRGLNTAFNPFVVGTQCGLCAIFVPVPPGTTRPGPINPGAQIPGKPAIETTSTLLAASQAVEADSPPAVKARTVGTAEGSDDALNTTVAQTDSAARTGQSAETEEAAATPEDGRSDPEPALSENSVSDATESSQDDADAAASEDDADAAASEDDADAAASEDDADGAASEDEGDVNDDNARESGDNVSSTTGGDDSATNSDSGSASGSSGAESGSSSQSSSGSAGSDD